MAFGVWTAESDLEDGLLNAMNHKHSQTRTRIQTTAKNILKGRTKKVKLGGKRGARFSDLYTKSWSSLSITSALRGKDQRWTDQVLL